MPAWLFPARGRHFGGHCASVMMLVLLLAPTLAGAATGSLYQRIGGMPMLQAIADELIHEVAADPALNQSFDRVNLERVADLLAEQLCELAGGPCEYSGENMTLVHAGLDITEREFNGMVEALIAIMQRQRIGIRERNELLRLLAPMKREVVTR